ncbi:uncharacterized protein N7446_009487 [Penicillium canescens]|uniref:Uncharacterized protein n=1 Tax=Penicillium canescens TaxID=5083 RepID=A0AAD6N6M4_PENCN|nr:uncharacterized protein N7446_009487 [Penicillium canescens]KAJ6034732.1 hypothetical protein N7460_008907 [Penicillium canescens]KAJ6046395.1 hypothetical protein N7444_007649 [Penicillium canescens]KAJ6053475.1 hypothetical protein N7446_009487 [Penicillium canescens]
MGCNGEMVHASKEVNLLGGGQASGQELGRGCRIKNRPYFRLVLSSSPMPLSSLRQQLLRPPATMSPASLIDREQWTISQRIVRQCCESAYRLLVNQPDNETKIQEIFDHQLTLPERNGLITAFYMAMKSDVIDDVERRDQLYQMHATVRPLLATTLKAEDFTLIND